MTSMLVAASMTSSVMDSGSLILRDSGDLGEESFEESEVAAGDAFDGGDGLGVGEVVGSQSRSRSQESRALAACDTRRDAGEMTSKPWVLPGKTCSSADPPSAQICRRLRHALTLPDVIIGTSGCQVPECVREEFERPLDFVDLGHAV
jgi:hypothetical protein